MPVGYDVRQLDWHDVFVPQLVMQLFSALQYESAVHAELYVLQYDVRQVSQVVPLP